MSIFTELNSYFMPSRSIEPHINCVHIVKLKEEKSCPNCKHDSECSGGCRPSGVNVQGFSFEEAV